MWGSVMFSEPRETPTQEDEFYTFFKNRKNIHLSFIILKYMTVYFHFPQKQKQQFRKIRKQFFQKNLRLLALILFLQDEESETQPRKKKKLNNTESQKTGQYLPDEILWRQKEQFSDGVGYSWIDGIKANASRMVSDSQLKQAANRFPINTPKTKEAYFVRQIYCEHFPSDSAAKSVKWQDSIACSSSAALKWDESFQNRTDDSGRSVLGVHNAAYGAEFKVTQKHT